MTDDDNIWGRVKEAIHPKDDLAELKRSLDASIAAKSAAFQAGYIHTMKCAGFANVLRSLTRKAPTQHIDSMSFELLMRRMERGGLLDQIDAGTLNPGDIRASRIPGILGGAIDFEAPPSARVQGIVEGGRQYLPAVNRAIDTAGSLHPGMPRNLGEQIRNALHHGVEPGTWAPEDLRAIDRMVAPVLPKMFKKGNFLGRHARNVWELPARAQSAYRALDVPSDTVETLDMLMNQQRALGDVQDSLGSLGGALGVAGTGLLVHGLYEDLR
jgi:hypothetical protein